MQYDHMVDKHILVWALSRKQKPKGTFAKKPTPLKQRCLGIQVYCSEDQCGMIKPGNGEKYNIMQYISHVTPST